MTHLPVSLAFRKFPLQFDTFLSLYLFILLRLVRKSESRSQDASRNFIFTGWLGKHRTCLIILSGLRECILNFNCINLNAIKLNFPEIFSFPKDGAMCTDFIRSYPTSGLVARVVGTQTGRNVLLPFLSGGDSFVRCTISSARVTPSADLRA